MGKRQCKVFQKCFMNFFSLFSSKSLHEKLFLCRISLILYLDWKYCHVVAVFALSAEQKRPCKGSFKFPFTYSRNAMDWNHSELSVHHSLESTGKAARCQQHGDGFSFNWVPCSGKRRQASVSAEWPVRLLPIAGGIPVLRWFSCGSVPGCRE